jgi:hypothetical protein
LMLRFNLAAIAPKIFRPQRARASAGLPHCSKGQGVAQSFDLGSKSSAPRAKLTKMTRAQLFFLVLDIGSNSRAVNLSADKKCSHSYRAKCA